jgi:type II secretory pathway pseudopilin PulG
MVGRNARIHGPSTAKGFTVLNLAIGLMVVAIVMAIAVPTVVMPRIRGNDTSARIAARRALEAQRTVYADGNGYGDAAALEAAEPSLDYTDEAIVAGKVYVRVEGDTVTLASRTAGGTCYWIRDTNGVDSYASAPCETPAAALEFGPRWGGE